MSRPVFLPDDIVKHWPEVFKGIKVKAIPLEYLDAFHVTFSDGKKWIVECKQPDRPANYEREIRALFNEYGPVIKHVEFKVDSARVKNYIQKETRKFLKRKRKPKS